MLAVYILVKNLIALKFDCVLLKVKPRLNRKYYNLFSNHGAAKWNIRNQNDK